MRKKFISLLCKYEYLHWLLWFFHYTIGRNHFRGLLRWGNKLQPTTANIFHDVFDFRGSNNVIFVEEDTDLHNSSVLIKGAGNKVYFGKHGFINGLLIVIEGNNNTVSIGDNAFFLDDIRLYVVDGSAVYFGNHCMLSDRIEIRTTDNHAILDIKTGLRINQEEDVVIGDDVWVGTGVTILKGAEIPDGCIIGAKSVITRKYSNPNTIIVGNPGREIRNNVRWTMER